MTLVKNQVEQLLQDGENIIECLSCSFVAYYCLVPQAGYFVATNKRLLFYGIPVSESKKELVEEFAYRKITSIEEKRGITGKHIHMYYNQDVFKFQQIQGMNMFEFMIAVKDKICTEEKIQI
ncbi:PH domain-containing protein [Cytobacillus oceanisediminis]|uniref:PH (Pleckstrin Homology) domain-containing protein n=1 Tax=Cytobacillus oceanisediminis TaxID=665099 RepID=A0A562JJA0_9BACI|nr:PH domain-containing protein [Cytobacillus oceanisediminis]TWH83113.1 PH (Pleckstrin Homology) domain-containing protein [Cytobacillus oceanisediminis]